MIDFHCHLDLFPDPAYLRAECLRRGLYVLSVTTTPSAWPGTSALAREAPRIRTALGLHPQLAHERYGELQLFDRFINETPYVGEIGLDGHPEFRPHWRRQTQVFDGILLKCAAAGGRVMSIHSRRAATAVLDSLEGCPGAGVPVLHWFSGSLKELERAIRLGCWFSVGPAMLGRESGRLLASRMPKDRVLTESDGPFGQLDGRAAMPWDVEKAVHTLSALWSCSTTDAELQLHNNLRELLTSADAIEPDDRPRD